MGVVTAYLAHRGEQAGWSVIGPVAREVERRQHGFPSGVDAATVYHGGVTWCRPGEESPAVEPLPARSELLRRIHVFDTGPPAETTGTVVAGVRARRDRNVAGFEERLKSMQRATEQLRDLLVDDGSTAGALAEPVRRYQQCLDALGVVPSEVGAVVEEVEAAGGAAKISGAGSLSGPGAGSLLVVHPSPKRVGALERLHRYEVPLGAEGARVESVP